jgi:hypothetical protein
MALQPLSIDTPSAAVSPPQLTQRPLQIGDVFLPDPVLKSIFRYEIFRLNSKFFALMDTHKLLYGPEEKVVVAHYTPLLRNEYNISFI